MSEAENNNWVQLQRDIKPHLTLLDRAAATVRDEGVSNYPIFVAYAGADTERLPGIFVAEVATPRQLVWTVNLSTLEEMVAKQIIDRERLDPFRKVYRESADGYCFLIIDEAGARFGFIDGQ